MKTTLKIFGKLIVAILTFFGIAFIALLIYYFPVIDRLYVRPCHYYPNMFSDCRVIE
jgi:hypothetical protein